MKNLIVEVVTESCPFQIIGELDGVGFYYRARSKKWQVWLNPDGGLSVKDWLENMEPEPHYWNSLESEKEDDLIFALAVVIELAQKGE